MSLANAFRSAAKAAFAAAGDVKLDATFKKLSGSAYNPTTGAVTETLSSSAVEVIRVEITSEDRIGDHLDAVTGLYLILASEISGVTPAPEDILVVDGESKTIIDVLTDPVKAVWEVGV